MHSRLINASLCCLPPPPLSQARYYREKLRVSGEAGRRAVVESYIQVGVRVWVKIGLSGGFMQMAVGGRVEGNGYSRG